MFEIDFSGLSRSPKWEGQCHRCRRQTNNHIMSMYNTSLICMGCKDEEKKRPDYQKAVDADCAAIKGGNYNFKGIGIGKGGSNG